MSEKYSLAKAPEIPVDLSGITASPKAIEQRDKSIELTSSIVLVDSQESAQRAVEAAQVAKGFVKSIEELRTKEKKPFLNVGAKIDEIAKSLCLTVLVEVNRVESLVGQYHLAERRKAEAAAAEARRVQEEQEAKARELKRQQEEATRRAQEATSKAAREKAEKEAADARKKQLALEIERSETEGDTAPKTPEKFSGASVRPTYKIEVTDLDALYKAHPFCVKLEPKLMAIRDLVNAGNLDIPGVKLTEEVKVSARGVSPTIALE